MQERHLICRKQRARRQIIRTTMPPTRQAAVALFAVIASLASAQSCISLQGSTQCPAFNTSSISTDSTLTGLLYALAQLSRLSVANLCQSLSVFRLESRPVRSLARLVRELELRSVKVRRQSQYLDTHADPNRYQQLLGCNNIDLTDTTDYYARYTTSVICNSIVQNSIKPCSLSGNQLTPLCADSCVRAPIC